MYNWQYNYVLIGGEDKNRFMGLKGCLRVNEVDSCRSDRLPTPLLSMVI